MTVITAESDPALLSKLAELASSEGDVVPTVSELLSDRPRVDLPADNIVQLPAGTLDPNSTPFNPKYITTAEVRELNGYDEEKLARVPNVAAGRLLSTILELGTVKIGELDSTTEMLDELLVGDREAILVGIRIATYGKDIDIDLTCPNCGAPQKRVIDLTQDLEVKTLGSQQDRSFEVELAHGNIAVVTLPTGSMQKTMIGNDSKTFAQLNTMLLASCIQSLNGLPTLGGTKVALDLSVGDRQKIVKALADRAIGPKFGEVSLLCEECSEKIPLPLTLADLFLL